MTTTPSHHHPIHGIVPPHILDAIARNGTPAQRETALETLALDATLRTQRLTAVTPTERPEGDEGLSASPTKRRSIHDAKNTRTLPGRSVREESDPPTGDVEADEVYDGFGATWDLYFDIYGRNSYDDSGATLKGTVHFDTNYNNAFWNGSQMVFGDGDGVLFTSFTSAIDVMAHELTHAVTSHESDLEYQDQSGALNESLSDVFGSLVKQRAASPPQTADQADWLIGAGILGPGINGVALRSMKAPGTAFNDPVLGKDPQPAHMDHFVHTSKDNGGVHINSGIPNHAFFLFATALGGFAWERAGRVWYATATDDALPSDASFQVFANLTADHAFALFGPEAARMCAEAWAAVGIFVPSVRHMDRSAQYGTPAAGSAPTSCVLYGLGVSNIAYRDTSGSLHELWRDAQGVTGTTNLTANAGAPSAVGEPFAYVDTSRNVEILLFRSSEGTVRSLYWSTGAVGHDNLSGTAGAPAAAGDPVGYYDAGTDTHHVVYRGGDGHLHELYWVGVTPVGYGGNLTATIGAPASAGNPSAMVNADGFNIVAYRGTDGHILSVYWKDGPSGLDDLSGVAGTPSAAGDPVAYYTAHNDTHQIVYQGSDGHLWELYWQGAAPVAGWNLTASAGAPFAAGRPATYYSAGTNTKHVIYRSGDGGLHELWWVPGEAAAHHEDLTAASGAPKAADHPTAFTVEGPNTQHVAYRANDQHIHELAWR